MSPPRVRRCLDCPTGLMVENQYKDTTGEVWRRLVCMMCGVEYLGPRHDDNVTWDPVDRWWNDGNGG